MANPLLSEPTTKLEPWHASFPAPRQTQPASVQPAKLLQMIQSGNKEYILVDLRRDDHVGGTIKTSLNMPAQTVWYGLPALYGLCQQASINQVIFYCGSCGGRGTRAAGWFDDYIQSQPSAVNDAVKVQSAILAGGIKGWVARGGEYVNAMDGFDKSAWQK